MQSVEGLRIAAFTDSFDEVNGAATTYRRLFDYAATTGKHVDIYCYGSTSQAEEVMVEERGQSRVFRFRPRFSVRYYEQLRFELLGNRYVRQIFWANHYDVVHIAAPGSMGFQGKLLGHRRRLPICGAYHTRLDEYAALHVPKAMSSVARNVSWDILRRFYESCNYVLTTTPSMGASLKQNGLKSKMALFSRGVNTDLFHPSKRTSNRPIALYVGRISEEKNLSLIADALQPSTLNSFGLKSSGLNSSGSNSSRSNSSGLNSFRMRFVGDGPYAKTLKRLIPHAEFTGYLHGEPLAEAYANASLFVFPSLTDTFGNVVQEAMASGVPSLVLDEKGPGELIRPGEDGFLARNPDHFKQMFWDLMRQPEMLKSAGIAARRSAEGRTWKIVFDNLWRTYGDCTSL